MMIRYIYSDEQEGSRDLVKRRANKVCKEFIQLLLRHFGQVLIKEGLRTKGSRRENLGHTTGKLTYVIQERPRYIAEDLLQNY